jgi:sugar phosphate isomerase/epimerase
MRLGTTSYIYPADILTNVRKLAGRVEDIELVLFEADDENNLPDKDTIRELNRIARDHSMTFTVHLPLDLTLAACNNSASIRKAVRVLDATVALSPVGFIVHLEDENHNVGLDPYRWVENSVAALSDLGRAIGDLERMCAENLENHDPLLIDSVLARVPVSCCLDVGHLWKQRLDPVPHLERWLPRTRVVHIHGMKKRDHQGLSAVATGQLDPVVSILAARFSGVLSFEVFSEADLLDSMKVFEQSVGRTAAASRNKKPGA